MIQILKKNLKYNEQIIKKGAKQTDKFYKSR